ncbi:LLM class flavin-dependent oxidoreductase [Streptomyces aurantiacus]|uniref:LLM class flavin-dependent oxidoreductase n=1 Tax=Streptomyces aurantiacus TaxID=47760 RepID=UPI00216B135D|nr:LLM class flavin-dependent oxidoreductase [Streptomyces aurantiacus]
MQGLKRPESCLMRFGIDIAQKNMPWNEVVSRVKFAEDLGFDCAWGFDHLASSPGDGAGETFEGMTTLAALSGVTHSIRLGLLVTGVTYRHPSVFAAQAMTVDHASGGRLNLALGAAWNEGEHKALGIPFPPAPQRFDLLADTVEIINRLFSGEEVSYDGVTASLRQARLTPGPVQRPRPPIWIGGTGPRRTLPLTAWFADGWHAYGTPRTLEPYTRRLDELAEAAGRNPAEIVRASTLSVEGDMDDVCRNASEWRESGWDYLVCSWPHEGRQALDKFAERVLR